MENPVVQIVTTLATSPTALQILWFGLIGLLWAGYLILEGFDFGVGMLLPILGKTNKERRAMLTTIGPLWDGNEVWLLTAGGATFAAFPEWYATLFSAAYLPLFLILLALIVRAVAFEYRGKIDSARWRRGWDWCITLGSWLPAVLWGVAFGNLVGGVPARLDATQLGPSKLLYDGDFFDLVKNPYALYTGVCLALLFAAHGAIFTSMKTSGDLRKRAEGLASKLMVAATLVAAGWAVWTQLIYSRSTWTWGAVGLAAVALILAALMALRAKMGWAFAGSAAGLAAAVVLIFGSLFPNVINASSVTVANQGTAEALNEVLETNLAAGADITSVLTDSAQTVIPWADLGFPADQVITGLPIHAAASTESTLKMMTIVACCLVPFVLAYQAWTIWVFRKRISADRIPDSDGILVS
ncbi:MAG: cytochrome d ubiquinol oxidase subunit II [Micrococcales bacterium]|nr:cytochrome d ubiquinol oxidase subunit II [Micrococcales bacterium]